MAAEADSLLVDFSLTTPQTAAPQLAEVIGRQRSRDRAVLGVFRVCYRGTGCLNQYREIWLPPGWQVQEFHRPAGARLQRWNRRDPLRARAGVTGTLGMST
ncbi:hypothetical protein BSZ40_02395 [Buchananella hordeovulneris]|uniref:Uncharacterized protein n=1 Tax=Buchananella hordeovulneris TaxID=52770 RepID=A0A1Q5PY17_9ACTO|nr:hypothetical protein BSZ40_02395 [Buchananella hordeovulneris]